MMKWLDRIALGAIGAGLVVTVLPGWALALQVGFFVTLVATVLHIATSHLVAARA